MAPPAPAPPAASTPVLHLVKVLHRTGVLDQVALEQEELDLDATSVFEMQALVKSLRKEEAAVVRFGPYKAANFRNVCGPTYSYHIRPSASPRPVLRCTPMPLLCVDQVPRCTCRAIISKFHLLAHVQN